MPMDRKEEIWFATRLRENDMKREEPAPWRDPRTWREWLRQRAYEELRELDEIRQRWIRWIRPFVDRVEEEVQNGEGFDPKETKHLAAIQALLAAVPQTIKEMRANIRSLAEFYGHLSKKPEEPTVPAGVSIQQAFICVAERMGASLPHRQPLSIDVTPPVRIGTTDGGQEQA
jgi:hypothetical protein